MSKNPSREKAKKLNKEYNMLFIVFSKEKMEIKIPAMKIKEL